MRQHWHPEAEDHPFGQWVSKILLIKVSEVQCRWQSRGVERDAVLKEQPGTFSRTDEKASGGFMR